MAFDPNNKNDKLLSWYRFITKRADKEECPMCHGVSELWVRNDDVGKTMVKLLQEENHRMRIYRAFSMFDITFYIAASWLAADLILTCILHQKVWAHDTTALAIVTGILGFFYLITHVGTRIMDHIIVKRNLKKEINDLTEGEEKSVT